MLLFYQVGDFAILLRAGFTRIQAVKLQLLTASGGVFGAIAAYAGQLAGMQHFSMNFKSRKSSVKFLHNFQSSYNLQLFGMIQVHTGTAIVLAGETSTCEKFLKPTYFISVKALSPCVEVIIFRNAV